MLVADTTRVISHLDSLFPSGIFFVLPCIESYQKVDLRTITLDVPPQEVIRYDDIGVTFLQVDCFTYTIIII